MAKSSDRPPLPPPAPSFEVEYLQPSRPRRRRKPIHVVVAIAASIFIIFTSAMAFSFRLPIIGLGPAEEKKPVSPLELTALGKTPSQLNQLHRDLSLGMGPLGEKTATFNTPAGIHTVWFVDRNGSETAFLIRLDRRLPFTNHEEVNDYLSGLFGAPAAVDCQRGYIGSRDSCRFRWWLDGNVTLRADSAFSPRAASPEVDLALIAQDTRLGAAKRPKAY